MADDHVDSTAKQEEIDSWWVVQLWTLAGGLVCGLMAHFISRLFTRKSIPPTLENITNFPFSTDNKMVLVVRTDIGMGKGKAAAQCAHAAVDLYKRALHKTPKLVRQWEAFGQAKVAVKSPEPGDEALTALSDQAESLGMATVIVRDAGHTQLASGTSTVLGIGPAPADIIDKVTGHLKLY